MWSLTAASWARMRRKHSPRSKPTASFVEDLGADSLDLVELIMSLEETFSTSDRKVEIPDEDAEKIITVQDAVDYIKDQGVADS